MKFDFIAKHRSVWPVAWLCEALGVSRSGFHAWLKRGPIARSREDEGIMPAVRASFVASARTYGARRIWRDVLEAGFSCGLHKIERLMRAQTLRARPRRRAVPMVGGDRSASAFSANVLDRQFTADQPNRKWIADVTNDGRPCEYTTPRSTICFRHTRLVDDRHSQPPGCHRASMASPGPNAWIRTVTRPPVSGRPDSNTDRPTGRLGAVKVRRPSRTPTCIAALGKALTARRSRAVDRVGERHGWSIWSVGQTAQAPRGASLTGWSIAMRAGPPGNWRLSSDCRSDATAHPGRAARSPLTMRR